MKIKLGGYKQIDYVLFIRREMSFSGIHTIFQDLDTLSEVRLDVTASQVCSGDRPRPVRIANGNQVGGRCGDSVPNKPNFVEIVSSFHIFYSRIFSDGYGYPSVTHIFQLLVHAISRCERGSKASGRASVS